ncbi:lipopolysaccharide biosynthesis protein [Clostridium sp.]|uniref:lipopolysaccharide biosynthesis protein n=1 Tax=Clostridium sp. TaxID=1506 RepID=UPI003463E7CC
MIKYLTNIKKRIYCNENDRLIILNTVGAFLVKGGALIISLYTMPKYIRYFNNQQILGLWFTISAVLSWILTFDLGIGNGLRNKLVPSLVNKDYIQAKQYISSAYITIGGLVLLIICISTVIFRFINWNVIFNISNSIVSINTLNTTVTIVFYGIMLQFLLKLITSILYAMQKSALINFLSLISSLITLIYVSVAKSTDISSNLISLAVVNVLAVNVPLVLVTILVFSRDLKVCKPNVKYFKKKYVKDVMKLGLTFLWVQIMYMIITTTNEFLITWFSDPKMVVEYQIYNKLFTLIGTVFTLALTPIWSAVTKALTEKKYTWLKKLYKRLKLMAILAVLCEFIIIPFLQFGINLWLKDNAIQVNYLYAVIFAVSGSIFIWNGVLSSFANGFGELKIQSIFFTIGAVINIPIAWICVTLFESWIGVVVANIISMSLYCIIQPIWLDKFLDKKEIGDVKTV